MTTIIDASQLDPVVTPIDPSQLDNPRQSLAEKQYAATQKQEPAKADSSIGRTAVDYGLRGATFGFGNKLANAIGAAGVSLATGEPYSDLYNIASTNQGPRMASELQNNPGTAIASELTGALGTGGAIAATAPGAAVASGISGGLLPEAAGIGKAANLLSKIGISGAASAATGALYGAGTAAPGQAAQGAEQGALFSGGIGAAIPVVGGAIGSIVNSSPVKAVTGTIGNIGKEIFNKVAPESMQISPAASAEGKILQKLSDAGISPDKLDIGNNQALVDVGGKNVQRLGEAVANSSGPSAQLAENFVDQRVADSSANAKKTISDFVFNGGNANQAAQDILDAGQKAAAPLYQQAFAANKNMSSPAINRVLDTPAGQSALKSASVKMQNDMSLMGTPDPELMQQAQLAGTYQPGNGGIAQGLNMRSLDYVKRALDDQTGAALRAGQNDDARILTGLKNKLVNGMDDADVTAQAGPNSLTPGGGLYKQARGTFSDMKTSLQSIEDGQNFYKNDPVALKQQMANMSDTDKGLFRLGVAQKLNDTVNNSNMGTNVAAKLFGKQEQKDQLAAVLHPDDYQNLSQSFAQQDAAHRLNQRILGNSRTALRQQEIGDLNEDPSGALMSLASGDIGGALKNVGGILSGGMKYLNRNNNQEIAKMLFNTNPTEQKQIIQRLQSRALLQLPQARSALTTITPDMLAGQSALLNQGAK